MLQERREHDVPDHRGRAGLRDGRRDKLRHAGGVRQLPRDAGDLASIVGAMVELQELINDIADTLVAIDSSGVPFKDYQPGVGPYGEPQLLTEVARRLDAMTIYHGARTKRTPDLLIPGQWALEFKIARPFGNNGKAAENWSVNLLHPYPGNVSSIGDCFKLQALQSK